MLIQWWWNPIYLPLFIICRGLMSSFNFYNLSTKTKICLDLANNKPLKTKIQKAEVGKIWKIFFFQWQIYCRYYSKVLLIGVSVFMLYMREIAKTVGDGSCYHRGTASPLLFLMQQVFVHIFCFCLFQLCSSIWSFLIVL